MLSMVFCHFCEIHGPSVVFCTDALPEAFNVNTESIYGASPSSSHNGTPSSSLSSPITPQGSKSLPKKKECDGCSFDSHNSKGFVSFDDDHSFKFVSSCDSKMDTVDGVIKQSCVRSLSCEIYPEGREGVIYFGDDYRGHVLSCCFVLKDSSARGFQRTYSILVISQNKFQILNNWKPLESGLNKIVDKLKEKANKVYDRELTGNRESEQERRSIRLDSALQVVGRGRSPLNTQRSESRARSLKDLTGDSTIFAVLHLEMSMLLRQMSVKEARLKASSNTMDKSVMMSGAGSSLRRLYAMLGKEKFKVVCYHVVVGHQVVVRSNCPRIANKILKSLSSLLPETAVRMTFDAEKYFERKTCNLISISTNVSIPTHVLDASDVLIMDLVEHESDRVKCTIHVKGKLPDKLPRYFTDLERLIRDTNFSDKSLDYFILQGQQDWMEKAKLSLVVYTTSVAKDQSSSHHDHQHEKTAIESSLSQVKRITGFDMTEADTLLLVFWMNHAITSDYKQKVFQWTTQPKSASSSVSNISTAEPPDQHLQTS